MSICPSKDLHSVFVDGEMPQEFRAEYLSHIQTCEKCMNTVKKLQEMRMVFASDNKKIFLSENQTEQSFKKLEKMMNFKKVTSSATPRFSPYQFMPMITKLVPAVAAALIIALVLPISLGKIIRSSTNTNDSLTSDYISQVLSNQSSLDIQKVLSSANISAVIPEEQFSLINTTENLQNVNLVNIINENSSSNIYASVEDIISSSSPNFYNMYKTSGNPYNIRDW